MYQVSSMKYLYSGINPLPYTHTEYFTVVIGFHGNVTEDLPWDA